MSRVIVKRRKRFIVVEQDEMLKGDHFVSAPEQAKCQQDVWKDNTFSIDENLKFNYRIPWWWGKEASKEFFVYWKNKEIEHHTNDPSIYEVVEILNDFAKLNGMQELLLKHSTYLKWKLLK